MVSVLISIRYYVANLILFISHTNLNIFFPSNFFSQSVEYVGHDIGLKEKEYILKILDIFQVIHQLQVCNKVIFACKSELLWKMEWNFLLWNSYGFLTTNFYLKTYVYALDPPNSLILYNLNFVSFGKYFFIFFSLHSYKTPFYSLLLWVWLF